MEEERNLSLPKELTGLSERLTLLRWRDPVVFFTEVTGDTPFSYQKEILKELPNMDLDKILISAAGNTGKTRLLADIALWSSTILSYIILKQPYSAIIESGSQEQSRILYDYLKTWIENNDILSKLVKGEPLKTNTEFKNTSFIKALPASWKSIFGQHANLVLIDEAVEAGEDLIEDSLRVVATHKPSRRIFSSTPHTYNSKFVDMWEKEDEYKDWKRYSWSALDCPLYTEKVIEEARKKGDMYFNVFYLGKPYALIGTVIPIEKIKKCSRGVGLFTYDEDFGYSVMGIDWGWAPDPTAISIIQRNDEQVRLLYYREKLKEDPEVVVNWIENACKDYKIDRIQSDSIPGYSPITIKKNNHLNVIPIEELVIFSKDNQVIDIHNTFEIGHRNCWRKIKNIRRHSYEGEILEIRTIDSIVHVTPNHPMILREGKSVRADNLKIGDKLATEDYSVNRISSGRGFFIGNEELAWFYGFFLAEGWATRKKYNISIGNTNSKFLERVKRVMENQLNVTMSLYSDRRVPNLNGNNKELAKFLRKHFYSLNGEKKVPSFIFQSPDNIIKAFLEGVKDGDGRKTHPFQVSGKSMIEIQGLLLLWEILEGNNLKYGVSSRKDKQEYKLWINSRKGIKEKGRIISIRTRFYNGYVYDLEMNREQFTSGIGFCKIHNSHNKHMNALVRKRGLPLFEISFKGEKGMMQSNLTSLFEREVIRIPEQFVRFNWQLRQYTYNTKGSDDLVDSLMLACRQYRKGLSSELYFKKFSPVKKPKKRMFIRKV